MSEQKTVTYQPQTFGQIFKMMCKVLLAMIILQGIVAGFYVFFGSFLASIM